MRRAGSKDDLGMFLWALAGRFDSADEMNAVADLVSDAGGATMALRLAKASAQRGVDIDHRRRGAHAARAHLALGPYPKCDPHTT